MLYHLANSPINVGESWNRTKNAALPERSKAPDGDSLSNLLKSQERLVQMAVVVVSFVLLLRGHPQSYIE